MRDVWSPDGTPTSEVPGYLLFAGDLDMVPLALRTTLASQAWCGRLAPDSPDDDADCAAKVVVAEPRNQLVLKLDPEVGQVFADPMPLRRVISNLLSNACKFTKDGRITLGIPLSKKIDDPMGPRVRVSVSDSGIGMSSEEAGDDE